MYQSAFGDAGSFCLGCVRFARVVYPAVILSILCMGTLTESKEKRWATQIPSRIPKAAFTNRDDTGQPIKSRMELSGSGYSYFPDARYDGGHNE
jgi:hypothetical protein